MLYDMLEKNLEMKIGCTSLTRRPALVSRGLAIEKQIEYAKLNAAFGNASIGKDKPAIRAQKGPLYASDAMDIDGNPEPTMITKRKVVARPIASKSRSRIIPCDYQDTFRFENSSLAWEGSRLADGEDMVSNAAGNSADEDSDEETSEDEENDVGGSAGEENREGDSEDEESMAADLVDGEGDEQICGLHGL